MDISLSQQYSDPARYKPMSRIPVRRSSRLFHPEASIVTSATPPVSAHVPPQSPPRKTPTRQEVVTMRGRSASPIKRPSIRAPLSRTFVPQTFPTDILDTPRLTHPRLALDVRLMAPVFMGGATIEGDIDISIDAGCSDARRKSLSKLAVTRVIVHVVGIERCKTRQEIFRALATNVLHASDPAIHHDSLLPFHLDLPVLMGPPPYRAKRVGIKYLLSCLIQFQVGEKTQFVRQSKEITVLTVHDPEKALLNLSDPLVVSDELPMSKQKVCLTAGIHRQTWISGYLLFVDLQIDNPSSHAVRKIELQLEKATVYYVHSAPSLGKNPADMLRLPDHIEKEVILKKGILESFHSIRPSPQDFRTTQIEIPTGLVSIDTGRFFEIRYFLNVQISCSFSKRLKVQLPISLIHPNSIDIPPNALAQVTASIEHKHRHLTSATGTGSPYLYRPGQAFTAARKQSLQQLRQEAIGSTEIQSLTRALDASPRRFNPARQATRTDSPRKMNITRRQSAVALGSNSNPHSDADDDDDDHHDHHDHHRRRYRRSSHHASFDKAFAYPLPKLSLARAGPATEARVSFDETAAKGARSSLERGVLTHLRVASDGSYHGAPRLQRSTSGLVFDNGDKENQAPKRGVLKL
ncbi:MAG: hypothetical protein Q9163_002076 [Psora crenata]